MSTYECLLAAVLLASPPDAVKSPDLGPLAELLRPALVQAALDAEILDPREEALIQGKSRDPAGDLKDLQSRYRALLRAPLVAEGQFFPEKRVINDYLAANRSYKKELQARLAVAPIHAEALRQAIAETDQLHLVWALLRDARSECFYVTVRRDALMQMRDLIGLEAYYAFRMPPHLPVWHFPAWR